MSRRREVARPEELTNQPSPVGEAYEARRGQHRSAVLSMPEVKAGLPTHSTPAAGERAAYIEGSNALGRRALGPISVQERYELLMEYKPKTSSLDRMRVKHEVVEAAMRVPFVSVRGDATNLGATYAFAIWRVSRTGSFDWRRDLTKQNIDQFAAEELVGKRPGTINTYRSTLMRVMRGEAAGPKGGGKTKARTAHSEAQWNELWDGASHAGQWTEPALTHLSLSGGVGLRPNEINYVRGSWVRKSQHGMYVRVPNDAGEFRDVPVFDRYADVIERAAAVGHDGYLVMPQLVSRKNVLSHLKVQVTRLRSSFAEYSAVRARHYWISRMLATGVPAVVIAQVADIGPGTSLIADLLSDLPQPDLEQCFHHLDIPGLDV